MWILYVEVGLCLVFVLFLYHSLAHLLRREFYVTFFTVLGWTISFFMVFLLPDDLMLVDACSDDGTTCEEMPGMPDEDSLIKLWNLLFWACFFLTWLIFPFLQEYSRAGDFTVVEKLRSALRENVRLYAVGGSVLIILLIVIAVKNRLSLSSLTAVAITAGNAWGLLCLVLLLGYGLVEIPRSLWRHSNQHIMLKHYQYKLVSHHNDLGDAEDELLEVLQELKMYHEVTPAQDPFYKYILTMVNQCPSQYDNVRGEGDVSTISYKKMVSLHKRLMQRMEVAQQRKVLYDNMVKKALHLEDIISSRKNASNAITWCATAPRTHQFATLFNTIEFFWYVHIVQRVYQLLAIICALMSVVILWSEATLFIGNIFAGNSPLSLIRLFVNSGVEGIWLQVFAIIPLMYILLCTTNSLFSIRVFNYFHIIPHHQTNSNSLLFSSSYLCRLITPLAYNFFLLVGSETSAFVKVMGTMNSAFSSRVFGSYLSLTLPLLTLVVSLTIFFNVYDKVLETCHFRTFQFSDSFDDENIVVGGQMLSSERAKLRLNQANENRSISPNFSRNTHGSTDLEAPDFPTSGMFRSSSTKKSYSTRLDLELSDYSRHDTSGASISSSSALDPEDNIWNDDEDW